MNRLIITTALVAAAAATPLAAQNRIDGQSALAPDLADYGARPVGVRTLDLVNRDQVDIVGIDAGGERPAELPRTDRPLPTEVWYPAAPDATGVTSFRTYLRDGTTEVTLTGRAMRDAAPARTDEAFPLVLLSHGYPGNRYLLSHLGENLASKGYVVASIDHTDSTYRTQADFASTLVNRPQDQSFVLDEMARLGREPSSPLNGLVDAERAGLVGYSMGGYGALISAGASVTEGSSGRAPFDTLSVNREGSPVQEARPDPRLETAVAIGPWGRNSGFFDAETLKGVEIPMLFMAGSDDATSLYEEGVRAIWEETTGVDRSLLTFEGAGHNAAAPIPAPEESFYFNERLGFEVSEHYTDAAFDTVRMNNVAQHFLTAWLDLELKGDASRAAYLDLAGMDPSDWLGFDAGEAEGLRYETLAAGQGPAPVPLPASLWLMGLALGGLGLLRRARAA